MIFLLFGLSSAPNEVEFEHVYFTLAVERNIDFRLEVARSSEHSLAITRLKES